VKERGLELVAVTKFKEDGSDIAQAVEAMVKASPQAVMLLTLSGPAPKLVDAYLKTGSRTQFFALSIVASDALHKAIGDKSRGIIVTQIVPFPWDRGVPIVKDFQELMQAKGVKDYTPSGKEATSSPGPLEGLRAAARTCRAIADPGLREDSRHDFGGYRISFSPDRPQRQRLRPRSR